MKTWFFTAICLLVAALFIWPVSDSVYPALMYKGWAREVNIENDKPLGAIRIQAPIDWPTKIQEGRSLLEKAGPLKYETRNKKSTGELVRKQIGLAILDKNTGEIHEHKVWVREQEIKNYKKTGIINLEPDPEHVVNEVRVHPHTKRELASLCTEGACPRSDVGVNWWNSFNTDYSFPDNPNLVVIANKYLLPSSQLGVLPERSKNKFSEIIYAPYSGGLHVPELITAGGRYIEENIDIAFGQLEREGVMSRFTPGQLVTVGIEADFIKNIILVEHVDPDVFKMAGDGGKELVERVLVILGANKEKAYRYTGSRAGASGLAQFIRPTYQNIIAKYTRARMIKDYTLGMANHVNAIKAMVLFFDEHKKTLASNITRKDIIQPLGPVRDRLAEGTVTSITSFAGATGQAMTLGRSASNGVGITEEMLAAAYNGGPTRVTRSINKFGLAWIGSQLHLPSSQKILRSETLDYIEKFRSFRRLNSL